MSMLYCLFGHPVKHSRSPEIHHAFAQQCQLALTYEKREAPLDGFADSVASFLKEGGLGANVTVPFKQEAMALADELSAEARRAGAVNTLKLTAEGRLYGHNTDGIGLVVDLERLGVPLKDARIAILGAGGAVRGVLKPLLDQKPASLVIANRTLEKAEALAADFSDEGAITAVAPDDLEGKFDLVINGTSTSLSGALPVIGQARLAHAGWGYDMVYSREPTPFMRWASDQGGNSADGLGMLVGQARESFALWTGKTPDATPVLEMLRGTL